LNPGHAALVPLKFFSEEIYQLMPVILGPTDHAG
jgi:hypothetical protein